MSSILSGTTKLAAWTLAGAILVSAVVSSPTGVAGLAGLRALLAPGSEIGTSPASSAPAPLSTVGKLAGGAPSAAPPERFFSDEVRLSAGPDGNFHTQVEIAGMSAPVMVDTGASLVTLSFEQADRLGLRPPPSAFRYVSQTANGRTFFAKITLPSVRIGGIELNDVVAAVAMQGALGQEGLLGMSFLGRLQSYQVASGRLTLKN